MIVTTVDFAEFVRLFKSVYRRDNFTMAGYRFLFDYLNSLSDNNRGYFELDVIGVCCDFTEYSLKEVKREYNIVSDCATMDEVADILCDHTTVCGYNDNIIVFQNF